MSTALQALWPSVVKPVIGMLHAPPLPGAPRCRSALDELITHVMADAEALVAGGVDGLVLENFGDTPFFGSRVPPWTVSHLACIAREVRRSFDIPVGINVLRNDALAALGVALAAGARFIRVNVLCGVRATDQGIIEGQAAELLRARAALGAEHIRIFADVNVKHSAPLGPPRPVQAEVSDLIERGGAEAVIVSGSGTGADVDIDELRAVREAAGEVPVLIGSGTRPETVAALGKVADGFIVGTALKRDGVSAAPVDPRRVSALMDAVRKLRAGRQ